jgi:hypothetical protein
LKPFGELPGAVVEFLEQIKGQSLMSEADKKAVWHSGLRESSLTSGRARLRHCGTDGARLFWRGGVFILTGELPSPAIARLMDAILVHQLIMAPRLPAH